MTASKSQPSLRPLDDGADFRQRPLVSDPRFNPKPGVLAREGSGKDAPTKGGDAWENNDPERLSRSAYAALKEGRPPTAPAASSAAPSRGTSHLDGLLAGLRDGGARPLEPLSRPASAPARREAAAA